MSSATNSGRIAGLDGVRALAVLAVVLTHAGPFEGIEDSLWYYLVHGRTGVRVFFVLSGFLITGLLLAEYRDRGRISYRNFIARRALRIFPLYFLFLALATLFAAAGLWHAHAGGLAYAWLYVYNFVPANLYDPLLAHTWSLAVEEHFYLLWPLALILLLPRKGRVFAFIALAALASAASYVLLLRYLQVRDLFIDRLSPVAALWLLVGGFAAGLAHFAPRGAAARFCRTDAALALAACLYAAPALAQAVPALGARLIFMHLMLFAQAVGIGLFLLWIAARPQSGVVRALDVAPLRYIGTISYGIYIWQGFFLAVSPVRDPGSLWPPPALWGVLGIAIVAPLSYHYFEKPFLAMKKRFAGGGVHTGAGAGGGEAVLSARGSAHASQVGRYGA